MDVIFAYLSVCT